MSVIFALLIVIFVIGLTVFPWILIVKAIMRKPCKKTAMNILWSFIGLVVSTIVFCVVTPSVTCEHELVEISRMDASCTSEGSIDKQCVKCESEEKEKIPAKGHEWKEADCLSPKTCVVCNLEEGTSGGHKWVEAMCTQPKICSVCQTTEGNALSDTLTHKWVEATCTQPKTCNVCNMKEGDILPHSLGEWVVVDKGSVDSYGKREQKCITCDMVINSEQFETLPMIGKRILNTVVENHSGKTSSLEAILGDDDNSVIITSAVSCENSEQVVKDILAEIGNEVKNIEGKVEYILTFGDIDEGDDAVCLAMAAVDKSGEYKITPMSTSFKTERNEWINGQFSAWDGSHTVLKELIKDNLNDESSFKHINTTYIDVSTEELKNEVNGILRDAGYSNRVDIDDLFVLTEFSAKNAFNATIKNTALGIVDYSEKMVTLIGIE